MLPMLEFEPPIEPQPLAQYVLVNSRDHCAAHFSSINQLINLNLILFLHLRKKILSLFDSQMRNEITSLVENFPFILIFSLILVRQFYFSPFFNSGDQCYKILF